MPATPQIDAGLICGALSHLEKQVMTGRSRRLSRRFLLAALFGTLAYSPARAQSGEPPMLRTPSSQFIELRPRMQAPPLALERIDGKSTPLDSFRGKAVLLCFWATWCPPCRRELPLLERLRKIVDPRRLEIVAVSVDRAGKPAVENFLKSVNVERLRPYLDPQGRIAQHADQEAAAPFPLYGMPITYVIDRNGFVVGYVAGEVDWTSDDALTFLRHYMDG